MRKARCSSHTPSSPSNSRCPPRSRPTVQGETGLRPSPGRALDPRPPPRPPLPRPGHEKNDVHHGAAASPSAVLTGEDSREKCHGQQTHANALFRFVLVNAFGIGTSELSPGREALPGTAPRCQRERPELLKSFVIRRNESLDAFKRRCSRLVGKEQRVQVADICGFWLRFLDGKHCK